MNYINGLVSIVIPTYKRADKLLRAINSVINQTYTNLEILVVNDNENGDDYTVQLEAIMQTVTDRRVRLIYQQKHINGAAARNAGIRESNGEYIAFLDDDDYWAENKIECQVDVLSKLDDSYGGVSTLFQSFLGDKIISRSLPYQDGYIWEDILLRNTDVTTCSVLLRHTCLDRAGYFDESLSRHQEIQLLSFFTQKYKLYLIKEYLLFVDAWGENNPNSEKIMKVKRDFFESVKPLVLTLPPSRQKHIVAMHQFELAYVYVKERKYVAAFRNTIPLLASPTTVKYALQRVFRRFRERQV